MFEKGFEWTFRYKILLATRDSNKIFFRVTMLLIRQKQLLKFIIVVV